MKIEALNGKRKKKWLIGIVVFVVMVVGVATLATSLAKYQKKQSIPIVRGNINYQLSDLNVVSIKLEQDDGTYQDTNDVPTSGYTLNNELSVCKVNEEVEDATIEYVDGKISIHNLSKKGTKCYLYFDKEVKPKIVSVNIGGGTCGEKIYINSVTLDKEASISKYVLTINGRTIEFSKTNDKTGSFALEGTYSYELYVVFADGTQSDVYVGTYDRHSGGACGSA